MVSKKVFIVTVMSLFLFNAVTLILLVPLLVAKPHMDRILATGTLTLPTIQANNFVLLGEDGTSYGGMEASRGEPRMVFFNKEGKNTLYLSGGTTGGGISVRSPGYSEISLNSNRPQILFSDEKNGRQFFILLGDKQPYVVFYEDVDNASGRSVTSGQEVSFVDVIKMASSFPR